MFAGHRLIDSLINSVHPRNFLNEIYLASFGLPTIKVKPVPQSGGICCLFLAFLPPNCYTSLLMKASTELSLQQLTIITKTKSLVNLMKLNKQCFPFVPCQ